MRREWSWGLLPGQAKHFHPAELTMKGNARPTSRSPSRRLPREAGEADSVEGVQRLRARGASHRAKEPGAYRHSAYSGLSFQQTRLGLGKPYRTCNREQGSRACPQFLKPVRGVADKEQRSARGLEGSVLGMVQNGHFLGNSRHPRAPWACSLRERVWGTVPQRC